jgi:hypothetical protein
MINNGYWNFVGSNPQGLPHQLQAIMPIDFAGKLAADAKKNAHRRSGERFSIRLDPVLLGRFVDSVSGSIGSVAGGVSSSVGGVAGSISGVGRSVTSVSRSVATLVAGNAEQGQADGSKNAGQIFKERGEFHKFDTSLCLNGPTA